VVGRNRRQVVTVGLAGAVLLAIAAWVIGEQIRSPAQIAADTAAPSPSAITVPVEQRVLSSEVIVRGTVRYGSPQPVVLPTSDVKQSSAGGTIENIVTVPPIRGARVGEGSVALTVSGRPVFVLRGAQPSHRDLRPGTRGPDVRQLEAALRRMGFFPGAIDGRYDGATASAVSAWYESEGYTPFGPTDAQLDQLRAARAAASQARDAYLQSRLAARGTPGDIAQARIDLETARDTADSAVHDVAVQRGAISLAIARESRDNAAAAADVAAKRATINKSRNALVEAQRSLAEAPPDTSISERIVLEAGVREAADDVSVAQADLNASLAAARATRAEGRTAVAQARADQRRADRALRRSHRQVVLAQRRLRLLVNPTDTTLQRMVTQNGAHEARDTAADARRLARKLGVTVPANEMLFFKTLPLRIDSVRSRRGDSVTGRVMTVANSRLAIDSSLSLNDAKLVRNGAQVEIEDADLGVRTTGVVSFVADRPGTHQVDPGRIYVEIEPKTAPAQLVGSSVKLTIAVKSTGKAVLAVPLTALSVGADGNARVQVRRPSGRSDYVRVNPGLAAQGLVEVRPVAGGLQTGDLVVVGAHGDTGAGTAPPASAATGSSSSSGSTAGGGATGTSGTTGKRPSSGATP
jgi:peptidoglycan hydrolase-like protein with peptidoglycan-binding domain